LHPALCCPSSSLRPGGGGVRAPKLWCNAAHLQQLHNSTNQGNKRKGGWAWKWMNINGWGRMCP
jgi:hypothetical protein